MKIPAIKKAVESYSIEELKAAEEALYAEEKLPVEIGGDDEGEQLTHILAAIWIKDEMQQQGVDFKDALRRYTQRVRNSIS